MAGGRRSPTSSSPPRREATPHEAYRGTVARLVAEGDAAALDEPVYKKWLHAKEEGYRGLSVKVGSLGRLTLTAPTPLEEAHGPLITARLAAEEEQQAGVDAILGQLARVMRKNGVKEPAGRRAAQELDVSRDPFATPARVSPKRTGPKRTSPKRTSPDRRRKSQSPKQEASVSLPAVDVPRESPMAAQERMRREQAEARVAERQRRVEERALAAVKRHEEFAAEQAKRDAARGILPEGPDVDSPGARSLTLLQEMRRTGQINAAQYQQASIKIQLTTEPSTEEEPEQQSAAVLLGRRSPKLIVPDLEPARTIVWPDDPDPEPSRWSLPSSGSPERARAPGAAPAPAAAPAAYAGLRTVVREGPGLSMEPSRCRFEEPAEFSFELGSVLSGHRGDALICVLRRVPTPIGSSSVSNKWEPLGSSERLSMGRGGRCSVRLHQFGMVQLLWLSSLEEGLVNSLAELLAQAVLAGLARDGTEPDAAFRERFRLACVAVVNVSAASNGGGGVMLTGKKDATDALEAQVRTAVFQVAERREKEARERAAKRAAEAAEGAAIAAARAALPGQLREAAKEGKIDDYEVDKEPKQGMSTILKMGVPVDGVDDKGYTALYVATMYQKPDCVDFLLKAGAEVDKANKNDVTPLMAAARDGYTAIVSLLLAAGADYAQVDEFGRTPDSVAEEKGFSETAQAVKDWAAAHPK